MAIFLDPVSPLQAFGYSIALGGLVYYKLGGEKLKEHFGNAGRAWAEYGVHHPALRRVIVAVSVFLGLVLIMGGISSSGVVPAQYDPVKSAWDQYYKSMGTTGGA